MDLVVGAPKIPAPGETVIGGDLQTFPGGKGANQAVAAARLGAQVAMVGRVGDDAFGAQLRQTLESAGVDLAYVQTTAVTPSGVALIVVDAAGQNSIVVASGANMRLTPADVEAAAPAIKAADALALQLESPLETVQRAAELARAHGVTVILNPAPARPLPPELLALVDVLIPNESETAALTGLPATTEAELATAADRLRAQGVGAVILTLGARGALLAAEGVTRRFPAFPVDQVVDTTAAGDAFVGGLVTAVAEKRPLDAAIAWGNAAGALAVAHAGAQPSLPTRAAVEALLNATGR
jgi:ribokinase